MGQRLQGRVAIVTGAGDRFGRAIALALAAEGALIVANDQESAKVSLGETIEAVRAAGGKALQNTDVTATMDGGEKLVRAALDAFGKVDVLVHAMNGARDKALGDTAEPDWDWVISVNLRAMFSVTKPAAILMRQQRSGRIIGLSSTAGLIGAAGRTSYAASKDGIGGFIRTVARDMGRYGVTVNGIALAEDLPPPAPATKPGDVAPVAAYLCTDEAKDINGQMLYAAGGIVGLISNPVAAKSIRKMSRWTVEELIEMLPATIGRDFYNPAPKR